MACKFEAIDVRTDNLVLRQMMRHLLGLCNSTERMSDRAFALLQLLRQNEISCIQLLCCVARAVLSAEAATGSIYITYP